MRTIDTRGLSCPQPLVLFHQAMTENADAPLDVLVDNEASRENVTRAAEKLGFAVTPVEQDDVVCRLELRA